MSKIKILDDDLINKIAAGEVVERPASVVKELVENAIDAGAGEIEVRLEAGGCKAILVRDDGEGIAAADMVRSIQRHATSKISRLEDLYQVTSMGFRGEALAAISAVSRFVLHSTQAGAVHSSRLATRSDGPPEIQDNLPAGKRGTEVGAFELFKHLPARKSFLKAASVEFAACLELMQAFALAHPDVGFLLVHNEKEHLRVPRLTTGKSRTDGGAGDDYEPIFYRGEEGLRQRTAAIFGEEVAKQLLFVEKKTQFGKLAALISPPGLDRGNAKNIFTFVNNRWVKDKLFRYAILRGYHSHLLRGRYPFVVAHYYCEPSLVDVNVHPAKTEVRFQYTHEVQSSISLAVRESLREGQWAVPRDVEGGRSRFVGNLEHQPKEADNRRVLSFGNSQGAEISSAYSDRQLTENIFSLQPVRESTVAGRSEIGKTNDVKIHWVGAEYLGVIAQCYLLFKYKEGLLAVDQHAFHERILYEKLCSNFDNLGFSERLLMPEVVRLGSTQIEQVMQQIEKLTKFGFCINRIDAEHLEVSAVPSLLVKRDPEALLSEVASHARYSDVVLTSSDLSHDLLATMACHAAVRAGEELNENELRELLIAAGEVDFYHNCPHGRRVVRYWHEDHLGKWFDR